MRRSRLRSLLQSTGGVPVRDFGVSKYHEEILTELLFLRFRDFVTGNQCFLRVGFNLNSKSVSNFGRLQARVLLEFVVRQRVTALFKTNYSKSQFSLYSHLQANPFFSFLAFLQGLLRGDLEFPFVAKNISREGGLSFSLRDLSTYMNLSTLSFDYFNWPYPLLLNFGGFRDSEDTEFMLEVLGFKGI